MSYMIKRDNELVVYKNRYKTIIKFTTQEYAENYINILKKKHPDASYEIIETTENEEPIVH